MRMRVQAALKLEKAIPFSHEMGIIQLKLRDQTRYDRFCFSGFVVFRSVWCSLCLVVLFAMAALKPVNSYSVTTTPISCSDQRCSWGVQSSNSGCSAQNNICAYTFQYGGGSCTSGLFVSDVLQFDIRLITMTLGQTCCLIFYQVLCFSVFSSCIA
ncbi:hypothetical protein Bca52824_038838 [Brassica carinata]|uniref:Xylanase inhibitor N-terminal domain-containing protein n=1 Tax=Brassica carinata TaxID=52824 RepID=A0A8X7UVC2_BRACI|nr:hypothetical protein Bca52824_038838 [Brassica carinata]